MTQAKHTPGPWKLANERERRQAYWAGLHIPILSKSGKMAEAFAGARDDNERLVSFEECDARAHLIAAAPELLAALEELLIWAEAGTVKPGYVASNASAAIAKAKGGGQ